VRAILLFITRVQVLLGVLAVAVLLTPPRAERYGDTMQVVLPLMALACEAKAGAAGEFVLRYAAMFTLAHGTKNALGQAAINQRPDERGKGFPSAHTSTAVLGASALVHGCLRNQPVAQGIVLVAAGFVGASRIEADRHDIWQVLAGALLGWGCDRVLRRPSPARDRVRAALHGMGWSLRAGLSALRPVARQVRAVLTGRTEES
jgi:membrane-associated phospholipid phosphatase